MTINYWKDIQEQIQSKEVLFKNIIQFSFIDQFGLKSSISKGINW